jgi:hypothetical protein
MRVLEIGPFDSFTMQFQLDNFKKNQFVTQVKAWMVYAMCIILKIFKSAQRKGPGEVWRLMLIIPATWEVEVEDYVSRLAQATKVSETLSAK